MEAEVVIIGAGVIGLAVAAEIAHDFDDVFVLEKNPKFGQETSSRNSEVIHAGIYYPPDSLKARLCVEGKMRLYSLCRDKRLPHRRCGKLIVATDEEEDRQLEDILARARANGVEDIERFTRTQTQKREPEIKAISALFSASTGIIDSHRLMAYLEGSAKDSGVDFVYKTRVTQVEKRGAHHYRIDIVNPDGEAYSFNTRYLINCAGLEADRIASFMGIDIAANHYEQYFWKGEYFAVSGKSNRIKTLVYPVPLPNNVGLGVHATIDLNGQIKLGPNAKYIPDRSYDYSVDPAGQRDFFESASRFLPFLRSEDLHPAMAGIRPKLQKPGDTVRDFIIQEETDRGYPGLVNLLGIESPGLTSSLAIAEYVRNLMK
jgi:L-2-hydroxyglutarate oxidase LhgO